LRFIAAAATMPGVDAQEQSNLDLVLEYLDAFGTFDPEQYDPYLARNPPTWRG
jgi:hypothetical protein